MKNKEVKGFDGFSPETIRFFKDLKENNYKEWFEEHRDVYEEQVLKPFKALVATLTPVMYNIDAGFELRPHRVLSRIYRDVRFSKNKEPYKTGLWISFQPPIKDWQNLPGFFFELNDEGYFYGMGLYMAKKKTMEDFRDRMAYDADQFQKNTQKNVLDRGFKVMGEDYKRAIANDLPEYFQPWYQKKTVYVWKACPIEDKLFNANFADILRDDFVALEWLYNFMKED